MIIVHHWNGVGMGEGSQSGKKGARDPHVY